MPREHVDGIANLSNSRGASACVYGAAVLAIFLVGDQGGKMVSQGCHESDFVWPPIDFGCFFGSSFFVDPEGLAQFFGISPETGNALLFAARFIPEVCSPLSTRLRRSPALFGSAFFMLLLGALSLPELTVSNSLLFWFFFHCLFRAYPWLLAVGPPREFAATDHMGHIYGAVTALLAGSWHLFQKFQVGKPPQLQSWLASIVLGMSTLP